MLRAGLLPLKRYADFRGLSTRKEIVGFWLLMVIVGVITLPFEHSDAREITQLIVTAAVMCPLAALGARRLHDQGRSGWWLLLAFPGVVSNVRDAILRVQVPYRQIADWPAPFEIVAGIGFVAVLLAMALPPQTGLNRYGPDPRDDPAVPY